MSASNFFKQRQSSTFPRTASPSVPERFYKLINDIEKFLWACTEEEVCHFWQAIAHLRQYIQMQAKRSPIPNFLNYRRKNRDFTRILTVLADLNYPQMHLSKQLDSYEVSPAWTAR
jgi:hypothetical protein